MEFRVEKEDIGFKNKVLLIQKIGDKCMAEPLSPVSWNVSTIDFTL